MLIKEKFLLFVSHDWIIDDTVVVWLHDHISAWGLAGYHDFMVLPDEGLWTILQPCNVGVPVLHMNVVVRRNSNEVNTHIFFYLLNN